MIGKQRVSKSYTIVLKLYFRRERGRFIWNSGNILHRDSDMWGKGEPNDDVGQDNCVHMFSLHGHKLNDAPCSMSIYHRIPFNPLCEK